MVTTERNGFAYATKTDKFYGTAIPEIQAFFWPSNLCLPGLENEDYGRKVPPRWPRGTLYLLKLALTSPTSSGLSVGRYSSLADYSHRVIIS
jgi:hypothetical protein